MSKKEKNGSLAGRIATFVLIVSACSSIVLVLFYDLVLRRLSLAIETYYGIVVAGFVVASAISGFGVFSRAKGVRSQALQWLMTAGAATVTALLVTMTVAIVLIWRHGS